MFLQRIVFAICLASSAGKAQHVITKNVKSDILFNISSPVFPGYLPVPPGSEPRGISLRLKAATLMTIIDEIRRHHTDYSFIFPDEVKKLPGRMDVHVKNISIDSLCKKLALKFPINHSIYGNIVRLRIKTIPLPTVTDLIAKDNTRPIDQVSVLPSVTHYHTGYRSIQKDRATSAYSSVRIDQAKRNTGFNIIESLTGQVPDFGGGSTSPGPLRGSLRGPNTINGNRQSAVVVDNFLFPLNTDLINLDDIDSVTIIRDAAAGVEWGSFGSNGVLVFNTKKGQYKEGFNLSLVTKLSIVRKPNINYLAGPGSADFINMERAVFDSTGVIGFAGLSPVQDILQKMKTGQLGQEEGQRQLDALAQQNTLADTKKYLYQAAVYQHYHLNVTVGKPHFNLFSSLGVDRNRFSEKGNELGRITGRFNLGYKFNKKLEVTLNGFYAGIDNRTDFVRLPSRLPYLSLKDSTGGAAPIPYQYPLAVLSALPANAFLNWRYYPLDELRLSDNMLKERLYQFGGRIGYRFLRHFQASFFYQHAFSVLDQSFNHSIESFYTRDLINLFRQNDQGIVSWPIPVGSIFDRNEARATVNNMRGQIDYVLNSGTFDIKVFGGYERRKQDMHLHTYRSYGDDIGFPQNQIDYSKRYKLSINPSVNWYIPYINEQRDSANHTQSLYAHGSVTYKKKYTFSAGARADQTNMFAQASNEKLVPLWSVGAGWRISEESFFAPAKKWMDLNTRLSYGVSGNIDYTAVPFATLDAQTSSASTSVFTMNNPANKALTYERVYMLNAGLDFKISRGLINGSIDYYRKRATDLLQLVNWNPTSGFTVIKNNSGSIKGQGLEINLQTSDIRLAKDLYLQNNLLYAHATHIITSAQLTDKTARDKTNDNTAMPRLGYPVGALFALPFAGLDPQTGAARGYVEGKESLAYSKILTDTCAAAVVYVGPSDPTSFGSLTQTLSYKNFSLSWMWLAKWGYYMRKQALNYYAMYNRQDGGNPDYYKRWQQPGDEHYTDIPAQPTRPNEFHDQFFARSTANVIKADHLRLQYIQLGYCLQKPSVGKWSLKELQVHLALQNIGIVWRANKDRIDPDVRLNALPQPLAATLSIQAKF